MPARRVKLDQRGVIQVEAFADLVVFDSELVGDTATFDDPHQYPVGVLRVWVNGVQVVRNGQHTDAKPGRVLGPALQR